MSSYKETYLEKGKSIGGKSKDAQEINLYAMKKKLIDDYKDIFDFDTMTYRNIQSPLKIYCKQCKQIIVTKVAKIHYYHGCEICAGKKREIKKIISKIITHIKNRQLPKDTINETKKLEKQQNIFNLVYNGYTALKEYGETLQNVYIDDILERFKGLLDGELIENIRYSLNIYIDEDKKNY